MSSLYFYADDASQKILAGDAQKIISIGSDFGYGNFGDVLQHINALRAIKKQEDLQPFLSWRQCH
jgi:hypothetical protein